MEPKNIVFAHIASKLLDDAKKEFGTTSDFHKGAWLLPDGSLLNFSSGAGRHDHSEIKKIFPPELLEQDPEQYEAEDTYVRNKFLEAGAVRLVAEGGGVEASVKPTHAQMEKIIQFLNHLKHPEFFLELSGRGQTFRHLYDNTPEDRERAFEAITNYYEGKRYQPSEISQYHYSDENRRRLIKD